MNKNWRTNTRTNTFRIAAGLALATLTPSAFADVPFLATATYGGGSDSEFGYAMDIGPDGSIFLAGHTTSADLPNAVNTKSGFTDVYVMKFSSDMSTLHWSAYVGGVGAIADLEYATDCAATADGGVVVTGLTETPDFPALNALDDSLGGASDSFLFKLDADGSLVFSTYLGGSATENSSDAGLGKIIGEVEVAQDGSIFVAATTRSPDFPLVNPIDDTFGGFNEDVYVMKITGDGQAILASTYLGDGFRDEVWGMRLDNEGRPVIIGGGGPGWPHTPGALLFGTPSSSGVEYVTKLAADAKSIVWSAVIDRSGISGGHLSFREMGIGPDGVITVVGQATGSTYPVPANAWQPDLTSGSPTRDAIALAFSADGSQIVGGTFIGISNRGEVGDAVTVDSHGQPIIAVNIDSSPPHPVRLYKFNPSMTELLETPLEIANPGQTRVLRVEDDNNIVAMVATPNGETTPGAFMQTPNGMYLARWDMQDPAASGPAADLNGDGVVNGADLAEMLAQWNGAGAADLNDDGVVNGADLAALLANWS